MWAGLIFPPEDRAGTVAMWESLFITGVLLCLGRGVCGQGATALLLDEVYSLALRPGTPQTFVYELSPSPPPIQQVQYLLLNSCQRLYADFCMQHLAFHFKLKYFCCVLGKIIVVSILVYG